jgi:FdrA protein
MRDISRKKNAAADPSPASLEGALKALPGANLALISVAGHYAGDEAMKALERGLHVMLFSDNVPLEKEIELKQFAAQKGLLVMGPDCGTAIVNGVPLGFANVVRRGDIGVVAAAGTGLQEVTCLISNAGAGVSQAIGTGGRDLKKEVGGIMFIEALKALAQDAGTRVILLVSKPPDPEVLERIRSVTKDIRKPVVPFFLGVDEQGPATLEEAALVAVSLSNGDDPAKVAKRLAVRDDDGRRRAGIEAARRKSGQKYVRGLFSGATFCAEAQVLYRNTIPDLFSNAPVSNAHRLTDSFKSEKNTIIGLGEDEFTVGRPHPMIDYTLRNGRILEEAADPETAVVLLDVILGYGSHPDPAGELAGVLREICKKVAVICSVTGTDHDPQNRSITVRRLEEAGALVMPSNAAACRWAGYMVQCLGGK